MGSPASRSSSPWRRLMGKILHIYLDTSSQMVLSSTCQSQHVGGTMTTPTPEQIHSRRWATLGVLCLSLLVVVVDGSIVNVALPTLVRHLHASTSALQWVV